MCILNHKVKIIEHLMINHLNWIEDASVKVKIKTAKEQIQKTLKPGQYPGGTRTENLGTRNLNLL